jgi:hypothetical protein
VPMAEGPALSSAHSISMNEGLSVFLIHMRRDSSIVHKHLSS